MKSLNLPAPPEQYDPSYMRRLISSLTLWGDQFTYPVSMRVRFLDATDLPTVTVLANLPSGAVYNDTGTLKVKP